MHHSPIAATAKTKAKYSCSFVMFSSIICHFFGTTNSAICKQKHALACSSLLQVFLFLHSLHGRKDICATKVGLHLADLGQCELPRGVLIYNTWALLIVHGAPPRSEAEDGEHAALGQAPHEEIHGFQSYTHPILMAHTATAVQHEEKVKVGASFES